jgi:site-specific DNA-methyltransferase (adenine-specific)
MMRTLPEKSINCCVTSPPYFGLRDYGTASWEGGDINCDHKIPANEHDPKRGKSDASTSHTLRFNRTHCHKCGATRIDKQIGIEETPDAFVQKLVEVFREVKRVLRDDGTLWINIGDSYASNQSDGDRVSKYSPKQTTNAGKLGGKQRVPEGLKEKDLIGIPWMVAIALRMDGWYLRQDIIWHKPNPMPESVEDRCTKSHEYVFLLSKSKKYYYDYKSIKEKAVDSNELKNKRSVWSVNTKPYKGAHFATFPPDLIIPCILAGCPKGGVVLDPFGGSGTTAAVANEEGRDAILCELNPDYIPLINKRLSEVQPKLF